jgi:hypothetical protein
MVQKKAGRRLTGGELARVAVYCAILLWVNLYICRDFFTDHTAHMNSMHGFWAAMAKHSGQAWFVPTFWPYWYCGIPFEAAYAPLVPAFTAAWARAGSIPYEQAFGAVTGFVYCLGPLALFLMAWALTRAPSPSFFAGLFYSLTSVSQLLVPDGAFQFAKLWDARRLFVTAIWDDTPHVAALSLLPLLILCLVFAIEQRGRIWYAAGAAIVALMTVTSAFGPVDAVLVTICLLFVLNREDWRRNTLVVAGIGGFGYLMAIGFVPPSVWAAIQEAARASNDEKWTVGSLTDSESAISILHTVRVGGILRSVHRGCSPSPLAAAAGTISVRTGTGDGFANLLRRAIPASETAGVGAGFPHIACPRGCCGAGCSSPENGKRITASAGHHADSRIPGGNLGRAQLAGAAGLFSRVRCHVGQ